MGDQQATQRIEKPPPPDKPTIEWVRVFGGALAAVTSAVLLSTLGAAGTIAGAALGSMILTVGNALYSRGIAASKEGIAAAQNVAVNRVGRARRQVDRAAAELDDSTHAQIRLESASKDLDAAESELEEVAEEAAGTPETTPLKERLKELPWKRIALIAAGLFVVAMVIITTFELITGRAVSSYTGGSDKDTRTSFTGIAGGGADSSDEDPDKTPDPGATQDATPGGTATSQPSDSSTPSEEPSQSESASPSAAPTETPSDTPTITPSPSVTLPTPSEESG